MSNYAWFILKKNIKINLLIQNSPTIAVHLSYFGAMVLRVFQSRKENPQKLTQLSSRSHPRHLVGKRTAQKDITIDTTSDSQVNSNFPNRWSPASLTFNNYFYLFLYLYITWITTNNNAPHLKSPKNQSHLWSPASLTFNNYFYLFLYLYITWITTNNNAPYLKSPKNQSHHWKKRWRNLWFRAY